MSIIAWDQGSPKSAATSFNFSILITDENDNAPQFDRKSYEISVYENQPVNMVLFKLKATDADSTEPNSLVKYAIREEHAKRYIIILFSWPNLDIIVRRKDENVLYLLRFI